MNQLTERDLDSYQTRLLIEGLFINDNLQTDKIKQDISLQNFYLSEYFLGYLKWYIEIQDKIFFIDYKIKSRILDYLSLFRTINLQSSKQNKHKLHTLINECIQACNMLDPKIDHDIYLAEQYFVRTGESCSLDDAYIYVTSTNERSIIQSSIMLDCYYFDQFMYYSPAYNEQRDNYNSELALWSNNRILRDLESYELPAMLKDNCLYLIKVNKGFHLQNYIQGGISGGNRIRKEVKSLSKKIR